MSVWLFILALIGLADALYLLVKKVRKEKLVCFLGEDCDKVVKSKYGFFFGIPNEAFGVGFYLLVLGSFALSLLGVDALGGFALLLLVLAAAIAASLASLYLMAIQAFVLKEWCEWCLLSALVNFLILLLAALS